MSTLFVAGMVVVVVSVTHDLGAWWLFGVIALVAAQLVFVGAASEPQSRSK